MATALRQLSSNSTRQLYSAPSSNKTLAAYMPTLEPKRERLGIVFDHPGFPLRFDVAEEYQDWILVGVCVLLCGLWCLPCCCGQMKDPISRKCTSFVYTRLHVFFCIITYVNLVVLMITISTLPDWTVNEFLLHLAMFLTWVLVHMEKVLTSGAMLVGLFVLVKFRERIAIAAGLEHVTIFRMNWKTLLGLKGKRRPVEVFIWKLDQLHSAAGKMLKANDIFVECHMGYNEPMRTRVHNNAGSSCIIQESFQMNIDEESTSTLMTLLVKDQQMIATQEVARLMLSTREICGIEDQTGKRRVEFTYSQDSFIALNLTPQGKIWLAIAPVEDGDEERAPLMRDEDSLVTC